MKTVIFFLARRIFYIISITLLTALVVFVFIHLAPGDPYEGWSETLKEQFGVGRPVLRQYAAWVGDFFTLNWGISHRFQGHPVTRLVFNAYPYTLGIVLGAVAVAVLISAPLAFLSVFKPRSRLVQMVLKIVESFSAIPVFITGYGAFLIFAATFRQKILAGTSLSLGSEAVFYAATIFVLGLGNGAAIEFLKHFRSELSDIKSKMYMRAVRARSANYFKHLLKSCAIPVLTIISHRFVFLLSGAVVVEYMFAIPGIGLLSIDAAKSRDYPLILGITIITIVTVLGVKIALEMASNAVNPRAKSIA